MKTLEIPEITCDTQSTASVRAIEPVSADIARPIFSVGEVVCSTNIYGVKLQGCRIVRIAGADKWSNRYYVEPTDCPWMYVRESEFALETLSRTALLEQMPHDSFLWHGCIRPTVNNC
ncbi:hypothetical protein [Burkholderia lata]|uniref:hypothetical protein n=1 Tax=Burkholderia lata (strain ATCC 17760 / DSM 23089 / LMG 22485 / NCIMB 9086 / R18194 / 383) TaxID=482957 RepID=UPI003999AA04